MLTIKIGNKRIKLLNWIIFLIVLLFIIYIFGNLFFMMPFFKKTYSQKIVKENYEMNGKVIFKNAWFKCKAIEVYDVKAENMFVYNTIKKDLKDDGFALKNKRFIKVTKNFGTCKDEREKYEESLNKKVTFKLIGNKEEKVLYGNDYNETYVLAKLNNKPTKNVVINSNFNKNKIGTYVISYTLKNTSFNKERLYRLVRVVDEEKPVIKLNGKEELILNYGDKYKEDGISATDNYDGDITDKVSIKNQVNTKKPGTYKITYKVKDSSGNSDKKERIVIVNEKAMSVSKTEPNIEVKNGITYINGILLVNKKYALPKDYDPKVNKEAEGALKLMQADATTLGLDLRLVSGYRSYATQESLYNKYVKKDGKTKADTYSAMPGHSEHQTGLAFDVGSVYGSFSKTTEAKWLAENAHLYGFIIRYPYGKTNITGYVYEPWHIRYLGKETAKKVKESNLSLEEYLGLN